MLSRLDPPPGAWPSPLTARLAASMARLSAPQVAADGTIVFASTLDGAAQLLAVPPVGPVRVLSGDAPPATGTLGTATFALSPTGEECAYVDAASRLVGVGQRGGPARVLCSEPTGVVRYSPGGTHLAVSLFRSSGPAVAIIDRDRPDWPQVVTPPLAAVPVDVDWRPDGNGLAVWTTGIEEMPWDCGEIWHVPLDGGPPRPLVLPRAGRHVGSPRWLDETSLAYVTDQDGWLNLWRVSLADGRAAPLLREAREHLHPSLSPDGRRLAFVARKAGDARLSILDLASGEVVDPHPEAGVHGTWFFNPGERVAWDADGAAVLTTFSGPGHPSRIGRFGARGAAPAQWLTDHGLPEEVSGAFGMPRELTWERDGRSIQGWLHTDTRDSSLRRPLAVHLHGGPTGDAALWWYAPIAHLVAAGWAVLDVNYRGSVGFGRDHLDALVGGWGIGEVEDAVTGVAAATSALPLSGRTAVFGLSAGGFSTVVSLLAHPEVYAAGVAGSGVYDLVTLSEETVPQQAYYLTRLLGPSAEHFSTYVERSPLRRAAELTRPVLIWHGTAAPSTPIGQSERLAAALSAAGREHELRIYEGEGYGGLRIDTTRAQLEDAASFLSRTVLDR